MNIISRKEAIAQKLTYYYTGRPCKNGHTTLRSTIGSNCVECRRLRLEYRYNNKRDEIAIANKKWYNKNPVSRLLTSARFRAKARGLDFNIGSDDITIPTVCPVLGIPIILDATSKCCPNSPSIDRVDSSQGYTPANIIVVSNRANSLKKDATVDEMIKLATFYAHINNTGK